jgi:[acyl-carrier-protein] S-malonyltransferase
MGLYRCEMVTMKIAAIFPGQGSQAVGMAKEICNAFPQSMAVVDQANKVLGRDLKSVMFEGPEEVLKDTTNTQPALYTASLAIWAAVKDGMPAPALMAGHSLGEWSALAASGVFSFEDGLKMVDRRAKAMAAQAQANPGTMAAILGLDDAAVAACCEEASGTAKVEVANYNCPGQVVVSGLAAGVAKAMELAQAKGALKCIPLAVSGPFHSSFMAPAGEALRLGFAGATWQMGSVPVVCNVHAAPSIDSAGIQDALVRQVSQSVRWTESIRNMIGQGADTFVEIGSGRVLSGLVKKIDKSVALLNIEDMKSLEKAKAALNF